MARATQAHEAGWPRPFLPRGDYDGTVSKLPAIFVGGREQEKGDWLTFDDANAMACGQDYVCVVCGLNLNQTVMLGHTRTHRTDGPPAHPRCFALALKFCPRFTRPPYTQARRIVAYAYTGEPWGFLKRQSGPLQGGVLDLSHVELRPSRVRGLTRAKVLDLVKADPMGERPAL